MDEVVSVRRASRAAVDDIEPAGLRRHVDDLLLENSMLPGVLVILAARTVNPKATIQTVENRAVGVQLVYTGLLRSRTLIHTEPWSSSTDHLEANLDVLAADVLVSRGFYLLARTEAAPRAVETVRSFGRDQTYRRWPDTDRDALDQNLEIDIFELAVISGTGAVGGEPDKSLLAAVSELARSVDRSDNYDVSSILERIGPPLTAPPTATGADEAVSPSASDL